LIKIGAKIVDHGRNITLQITGVAIPVDHLGNFAIRHRTATAKITGPQRETSDSYTRNIRRPGQFDQKPRKMPNSGY
jgi:hypothetical protein